MNTFAIVTVICVLVSLVNAQDPDCEELGFGTTTTPSSGEDLKYCMTNEQQCCSNSYLDERFNDFQSTVTGEIRDEINLQINSLGVVVDGMEDYLRTVFVPRFSNAFCSNLLTESQCRSAIHEAEFTLLQNLHIGENEETDPTVIRDHTTGYSAARAVAEYLQGSLEGLRDNYLANRTEQAITAEDFICLYNYTIASPESERYVYDNLTQIRKSFTALRRLRMHINTTILPQLLAVEPTNTCIESYIDLTCQSCIEEIPDICQGACDAILYGCLAPFNEGLRGQFNLLWSTTAKIVSIANELLPNTRDIPKLAFGVNISKASDVEEVAARCGITLTAPSTTTDMGTANTMGNTDDNEDLTLPEYIINTSESLLNSGAFNDTEPSTCQQYTNENCWNGTANVTENNIDFNDRTIDGQGDNPLANYNTTELRIFSELSFDMFVTGFLESPRFLDVVPDGVFNTSTNATEELPTDFDGNNSAGITSVGLFVFLATVIMGLFLN